jgi:hypothetical protein
MVGRLRSRRKHYLWNSLKQNKNSKDVTNCRSLICMAIKKNKNLPTGQEELLPWTPSPPLLLWTMILASKYMSPPPRPLNVCPMEVAVTLSFAGNHAAETAGGAEQKMIPEIPLRKAQTWQRTVNISWLMAGQNTFTHLRLVPRTMRPLPTTTDILRLLLMATMQGTKKGNKT